MNAAEPDSPGDAEGKSEGTVRGRDLLPDPANPIDWARRYAVGTLTGLENRSHLSEVERFVLFVGYPRSGHSLIGSLLNAHPDMVVAHELGVFDFVNRHFGRTALYGLILERDKAFASLGRQWTDYDYTVEGQFQGKFRRLTVIGDKRGRHANMWLARKPELLARLRKTVGVPIRILHVTRNPYDNIATMANRGNVPIDLGITRFATLCEWTANARQLLAPDEILDVDYDKFLTNPLAGLRQMCEFLGVDADQKYLDDCASAVWPSGSLPRRKFDWSDEEIDRVQAIIDRYEGFREYSFAT